MTKIIGSMLIIVTGVGFGISESGGMKRHLDALDMLKRFITLFRSELEYSHAPFDEIFDKLSSKFSGQFQIWILNLSERLRRKEEEFGRIWTQSIEEILGKSDLKKEDLESLKNMGNQIHYVESLNLYIEHLEYEIQQRREEYGSKRKLCQSMGILGGIFLVILLL